MSLRKIKVIHDNDIRIFKTNSSDSVDTILQGLKDFVTQSFKFEAFNLQFKDSENDLVTIIDSDDLQEAIEMKDKITRIYVSKVK